MFISYLDSGALKTLEAPKAFRKDIRHKFCRIIKQYKKEEKIRTELKKIDDLKRIETQLKNLIGE
jgi:hypothetical protein